RQLMSKLLMGGVNVEGVVRRTLTLVQLFLDLHHIRRPLRAYRTRVDDRVPIDIVDTGHDALLEFLLGSHPDVTQDRARSLDTNEESTNKSTVPGLPVSSNRTSTRPPFTPSPPPPWSCGSWASFDASDLDSDRLDPSGPPVVPR